MGGFKVASIAAKIERNVGNNTAEKDELYKLYKDLEESFGELETRLNERI